MIRKIFLLALSTLLVSACGTEGPLAPEGGLDDDALVVAAAPGAAACWGQASKVFAQLGEMGDHSSQQANPRLGLRNLARALADLGVIADDSMASLGAFFAAELGLSIEACGT